MNPAEQITEVCDELLRCVGDLKLVSIEAGAPLPPPTASALIDRILDIRNRVCPPKPKTAKASP